jgi:DNA mismatch repair protein MutL
MPIRILPDEVASQIAAGEVVERPASVVKELLENALDAGAGRVAIRVEQAGRRLIEVSDDGCGIPPEEISLAVSRHATSKLSGAQDLFRIATLGFRGEALASIASVSRLTLSSRPAAAELGASLKVDGGRVTAPQPLGAPAGTLVRVEDLFYNVPARLKFLKTDATERRQINDLVVRYALAYPQVSIHMVQDGKDVIHTSGKGEYREILAAVYGPEIARQLLELNLEEHDLRVHGFVSPPSFTRANRREITFFVNGRWVHDPALTAALLQAYHTQLMVGRYPLAILFVELPPQEVDVNVHPAKAEVRFRQKDRLFGEVRRAVRRALMAYGPVPDLPGQKPWPRSTTRPTGPPREWDQAWDLHPQAPAAPGRAEPSSQDAAPQAGLPHTGVPLLRLIGQVGAAYLVAEGPDGLYLIDQHAAHERVLYERFLAQKPGEIAAQGLLTPVVVQLTPAQSDLLDGQLPLLEALGFKVEPFGQHTYQVRAVPDLLGDLDPAAALRVLVEDFEEDETPLAARVEDRIIARVCKRAAVKAGQALSTKEQQALLEALESCQSPRTCPHGRPTMIHLPVDLLERQFGRRGSR